MGMGSTIPIGRGKSGLYSPNIVCPINGRTSPGPTSMVVVSGNGIIPLAGSLGAACLHLCPFLKPLLSIHSAVSESNSDYHSRHLHDTGDALCFPNVLTSFLRLLSSVLSSNCFVSALQWRSFSEESFSSRAFTLFVAFSYQSRYQESFPWASSSGSSLCGSQLVAMQSRMQFRSGEMILLPSGFSQLQLHV